MKTVAAALAFVLLTAAAPDRHPVGADDIARLRTVSDPQVAPAGDWIAYSVRTVDADADKSETHLWMTRWDGSRTVQLTSRKGESESTPRFSPDGQWIAFISGRGDDDEDDQLWLLNRSGGEAQKMAGIKGSVDDIVWSPDSKSIAMIVTDPDPNDEADKDKSDKEKRPHPIVIDRFQFKQDIIGFLGKQRSRLWLYDVAARTARRLTTGDYNEALPAFSPDGKTIAFSSKRLPDPDRSYDSNLYVVAVGAKPAEPRAVTTFEGADNDEEWGSYPAWSPDGKSIAYLHGGPPKLFSYGVNLLAVVPAAGGEPRILTTGLDRNVGHPLWSDDGRSIRFTVEDDGVERMASVPAAGGALRSIAAGDRVFSDPVRGPGGAMAVMLSSPTLPGEVHVLAADGTVRQISHQNDDWLKTVSLATMTRTSFKSKDGTEVHGFLYTPPGARPGRKLPTLLYNHGGPQSQFDAGFSIMWQLFAGHGMAVVSTNPRGGTGRGEAYAAALYADWGGPAVPDALAGVDDAVAKGIADPDRLYVGGWSYGGMLTDYLIASDTRFKAAVSGASIGNALAGYGTDQYIRDYELELGKPWETIEPWMRVSYPFFHNDRIVTPTLFLVGEKDFNVPALNSEQLYQGLKSRGIDTRLVIYPGQFHGFSRPSFLKDRIERWFAWYDDHGAK